MITTCELCGSGLIKAIGEGNWCYDCLSKEFKREQADHQLTIASAEKAAEHIEISNAAIKFAEMEIRKLQRHRKILRDAVVRFRGEATRELMLRTVAEWKAKKDHKETITNVLDLRGGGMMPAEPDYHRCQECYGKCQCSSGREDCNHCYIFESEKDNCV